MRTALFIILAAAVCVGMPGFCLGAEQVPTAFVGSFVGIAQIECESSSEATDTGTENAVIMVCMDSVFQATYRVEKVLEGKLITGADVTFTVADHYGFPRFAEQKRALIFLGERDGRYYHIKYRWAPAYRTNDGEFALCGCEVDDEEGPKSSPDCRSLSFSPAVIQDLTHSSRYVIDKLHAGLDYKVQGNRAECMRGFLVEDVYKRLRPELVEDLNAR